MRLRLELQAVRIAQSRGELPVRTGGPIDLPDRRTADFGLDAVLGDIAVGANARIELGCRPDWRSGFWSNDGRSGRRADRTASRRET